MSACRNLAVNNEEESTVSFAHHTVKQFLFSPQEHGGVLSSLANLDSSEEEVGDLWSRRPTFLTLEFRRLYTPLQKVSFSAPPRARLLAKTLHVTKPASFHRSSLDLLYTSTYTILPLHCQDGHPRERPHRLPTPPRAITSLRSGDSSSLPKDCGFAIISMLDARMFLRSTKVKMTTSPTTSSSIQSAAELPVFLASSREQTKGIPEHTQRPQELLDRRAAEAPAVAEEMAAADRTAEKMKKLLEAKRAKKQEEIEAAKAQKNMETQAKKGKDLQAEHAD
ncbi:hypothetical protein BU25DRAFT_424066 [Macroventuria anomochaeta]|uniref:Uncharacterized protein n=1 Tax=Macroventuria anomochaeta TaxID=301207 RepID=A0ACB6RU88_9PLEO|nr:uncharacterized protein BU25DRAFT_424066 [Macroventuria anomochaeta]KAF2624623.1 hypothetical protein BU25DRAFT_424066 [Macroventuria anomochaeta]